MKAKLLTLIACVVLVSSSSMASPINYTLDDTVGPLTVTGTITTDGYIGFFPTSACCLPPHILSWDLTITNGTDSETMVPGNSFIGGLSGKDGVFTPVTRSPLKATPNALTWKDTFGAAFNIQTNLINLASMQFGTGIFALQISPPGIPAIASDEALTNKPFEFASVDPTPSPAALPLFADVQDDPATPIPAALPLFATGLGVMGLFGWRRKRKNAAAAVAAA